MAAYRISMYLLRQIVQQLYSGMAIKEIARNTRVARNTIRAYRDKIQLLGKSLADLEALNEPQLHHLLCSPRVVEEDRKAQFLNQVEHWLRELKNPHVTRRRLWEEYIHQQPDGYSYTQFCFHLQEQLKARKISMVGNHLPGDKIFMDFAGDKLCYYDREQGKEIKCDVLLITLGFSNYTLAMALPDQKVESVTYGVSSLLTRLGGVCKCLVPDNMKTAVTKADRYEPVLNDTFLAMANHYKMSVIPARPRRPQDKSKVERAVNIVYQNVYARIRNSRFYSLEELNRAMQEEMDRLNDKTMEQYGASRRMILEQQERSALGSLPERPFELVKQYSLKVQQNGHVQISSRKQYFSVPYAYIGKQVTVIATSSLISIYYQGACIATHVPHQTSRYHTCPEHMATQHKIYLDSMNPDKLIQRGEQISPEVGAVIRAVLDRQIHPEQAYKSCNGILSLSREFGKDALIQGCIQALEHEIIGYKRLRILTQNKTYTPAYETRPTGNLPEHENIRGSQNYL